MKYLDQIIWKSCTPKLKLARIQNHIQPGLISDAHVSVPILTEFYKTYPQISDCRPPTCAGHQQQYN